MKSAIIQIIIILIVSYAQVSHSKLCPDPEVPVHAKLELSKPPLVNGLIETKTIATYECDSGYELFGSNTQTCSESGKWDGKLPYCAVNVAYGKPSNQSSTSRGGDADHANDGDLSTIHENRYCTQTRRESSPWWMVDLLQYYEIRDVRILTRGCCGHDHLQDLEIRVGNSSQVQGNRLCAWYPGTLDDGITKDFKCARPLTGRYVFVQMVGIEGSLSICELSVFTTEEFSSSMCAGSSESKNMVTFNKTCFEFQTADGGQLEKAEKYCQGRKGHVVTEITDIKHNFLKSELNRRKSTMKTQLVWIGAKRQSRGVGRKWNWLNGGGVGNFLWGKDQPNNYNGEQNCVVLDGGRRWLWNDVSCQLDYLPWICQYGPLSCGSPEKKENSTIVGTNYEIGTSIEYTCPIGNVLLGERQRECLDIGSWSDSAPSCKYVDCGALSSITNGKVELEDDRTTFNATGKYSCDVDYVLVGEAVRKCGSSAKWLGETPKCLYDLCEELSKPINGSVSVSSLKSGGRGQYSCKKGSKLYGNEVRQCKLGGKWTGAEPRCKYINCDRPKPVSNGRFNLVEGTTYYQSHVLYTCAENYTMDGVEQRTCLETGKWSDSQPKCKVIDCGEPDIPTGAYTIGSSYVIYSNVKYKCEPGHVMKGDDIRQCQRNSRWSGQAPICQYVDCGRIQPIVRGKVFYVNESTHLESILTFKCIRGYRLTHQNKRMCQANGRWSSSSPKCQEIRCSTPDSPPNATLTYGNNDRPNGISFRVGATVQYRCTKGYSVQGKSLRTCDTSGHWNGHTPYCVYVDCGPPERITHGSIKLTTNKTYYGSTVEYHCAVNYELAGAPRRLCLENGAWSHHVPSCREIKCRAPDVVDNMLPISGVLFSVGDVVTYQCQKGFTLTGAPRRTCLKSGRWSRFIPKCKIVDCGSPTLINNGKADLINGTFTYGSQVEYKCMPGFKLIGIKMRKCQDSGKWSESDPRCAVIPDISENEIDSLSAGQSDANDGGHARNVGIGVGISIGALLIVIVIVAVVCMRTRKEKPVKNTENVEVSGPVSKDPALVTAYNRIEPNSIAQRQGTTVAIVTNSLGGAGRDNPVYANHTVANNRSPSDGVYANMIMTNRPLPNRPDEYADS